LENKDVAFSGIITNNSAMKAIFQYIKSVALSDQPVLITGETGVGKELVANSIHRLSGLKGPLVTINIAGLDDNVFSDTLFGHSKGAFTGADNIRKGMVQKASGGTLVLDEIGDLTNMSQVKLLRLLQEGEYMSLGQDEVKRVKVRIVACTNHDLWSLQRVGTFRKDLNFRLRTHHIDVPPLRDRLDDLPLLIEYFSQEASASLKKVKPKIPDGLIDLLSGYAFPGNVRELQGMIFDAVSTNQFDTLSMEYFDFIRSENKRHNVGNGSATVFFPEKLPTIKDAPRILVEESLSRAKGNQTLAAKMLGISRQALGKRLKDK
jgi:transcriptional regulator with PAS, ATPase and Fis domain